MSGANQGKDKAGHGDGSTQKYSSRDNEDAAAERAEFGDDELAATASVRGGGITRGAMSDYALLA
jgi:hypothetical protein